MECPYKPSPMVSFKGLPRGSQAGCDSDSHAPGSGRKGCGSGQGAVAVARSACGRDLDLRNGFGSLSVSVYHWFSVVLLFFCYHLKKGTLKRHTHTLTQPPVSFGSHWKCLWLPICSLEPPTTWLLFGATFNLYPLGVDESRGKRTSLNWICGHVCDGHQLFHVGVFPSRLRTKARACCDNHRCIGRGV